MAWLWDQSEGKLYSDTKKNLVSSGYSGAGRGKNNPSLQNLQGIGPIPRGKWKMIRVYNSNSVGPFTIELMALDEKLNDIHEASRRSAFRIHGDSIKNAGNASRGCIILPRAVRERMWKSKDKIIEVIE